MDYKEILQRYRYTSDRDIKTKVSKVDALDYESNRSVINEIVLWKLNRAVEVRDETIDHIYQLRQFIHYPLDVVECKEVKDVLLELLDSKGIKIAMASTILHFYYPSIFPIIDQRAYRELTQEEMPVYHTKNSNLQYTRLYLDYTKKCYELHLDSFPDMEFEYIDKILYQLDKDKHNKVKY